MIRGVQEAWRPPACGADPSAGGGRCAVRWALRRGPLQCQRRGDEQNLRIGAPGDHPVRQPGVEMHASPASRSKVWPASESVSCPDST